MTNGPHSPAAGVPFAHVPIPLGLLHDTEISDGAKVLWLLLFQISQADGGTFEMGLDELVSLSGASRPSLLKRRDELVAAGWLTFTVPKGVARKQQFTVHSPDERDRVLGVRDQ